MLVNVFTVTNLERIKVRYRLFKVRGLVPQSEDFDRNVQILVDKLSRTTKSPCTVVKQDDGLYIAQPLGSSDPPDRVPLVGAQALLETTNIEKELDYSHLDEHSLPMATRFLMFYLDGWLHDNLVLWRPGAGRPYFQKDPDRDFPSQDVVMYRGFRIRPVILEGNAIGICVDVGRKYASRNYLPAKISPNDFHRYKGKNYVYELGDRWYEVHVDGINGLNATDVKMPDGRSLFDYIHTTAKAQKSQALLRLPRDCTVLTYRTGLGEVRNVPSALLRATYATEHPSVSKFHSKIILPPSERRKEIEFVLDRYLAGWKFQGTRIELSGRMLEIQPRIITPPDLEFGKGKILSLRQTKGAVQSSLEEFGPKKRDLLHSMDAGFFVKKPLDTHYLVIPKSMDQTFGPNYIQDLKASFNKLYSADGTAQYEPVVVTYDDSVSQSVYPLGKEILNSVMESVRDKFIYSGYGLVVIPKLDPRRKDKEDELGNLLMREFRKNDIHVSVAHTEVPSASYVPASPGLGQSGWRVTADDRQSRKLRGYMENIVLNKILLLNRCWPFVLADPLNSDLVIGLDVKNNTAGFMLVFKDGRTFTFTSSDSDQREQLSRGHVSTKIYEILRKELSDGKVRVRDVTVHRDGRLYSGEMKGIAEALNRLAAEGLIETDYNCNFVEIKKTSAVPIRFFEVLTPQGFMQEKTDNPVFGTYRVFGREAFLCTTGRPFRYQGTTKPIQIVKIQGAMDFTKILRDVFALANLTWTKPDYCSKMPISIKMIDIRLREIAGEYDEDQLKFVEEAEE